MRHRRRRRAAVRATALSRDEQPHLDRGIRLAERELLRLSRLLDHDRRGFVATLAEEERELADDVPARHRGELCPRRLGCARGLDRGRDVVGAGARDPAENALVGGPDLLQPLAGPRGYLVPVDEVVDVLDYQADQPPSTTTFEPVT